MEGMKDWNKMNTDEYIKHLEQKFMFDSSGTAKAVFELISTYKALTIQRVSQRSELLKFKNMNYLEIINELNQELYEKVGEIGRDFSYSTNGYVDIVNFGEIMIWNSEMDEREWIEDKNDYEPFKPFIKRMYNQEIEKLQLFKF